MSLCAVISVALGWDDIEDWGRKREAWLRGYLRLENGIPGHDAIRCLFESISPLELESLGCVDERAVSGSEWARDRHRWQGALRDFFSALEAPGCLRREVSRHTTLDKGHGRIGTRRCIAAGNLDWLELIGLKVPWANLASVASIESTREINGRRQSEKRCFIRSLPAERPAHPVRRARAGASRMVCTGACTLPLARTPVSSGYVMRRRTSPSSFAPH
jgi:hypothetical protein